MNPGTWPALRRPIAPDPAVEARVSQLLAGMTLADKVGQVIQADIGSITPDELRKYRLGSILSGGNSAPGGDELAQPAAWLAAADAFYAASMERSDGKAGIPVLWGIDAVHGHNNIIGATLFPHNIGLGAAHDPELVRRIGEITAVEVSVVGQDWTFAPTLAVAQDARWGRTYESYSEDPELVSQYATAMVTGLQGQPGAAGYLESPHVIATSKHFIGDGGTEGGRDQGNTRASEAELRDVHGAGHRAAVAAAVQSVMVSFSSWQGAKLHGHRGLILDVLKGRMHFDGIVVGDWNAHAQIPGCSSVDCPQAFRAGLDMFMAPDSWEGLYTNTLAEAGRGDISPERLNDAVRRILRVKVRAGLFSKGKPSSRPLAGKFELLGAPEHRAVAREAVRKSLVLLKNQGQILPLRPQQRVLVAGDGADNLSKQCGGWTLSWQGTGLTNAAFPKAESIYAGIRSAVTAAGGSAELSPTGAYTGRPDVAIVVFGEEPYAEFEGDRANLGYSLADRRDMALLKKLKAEGIPTVSVFLSGRPLWVNGELNASDAFVAAWLPGSEGGGVADVLFRKPDGAVQYDFTGKLSFAWPRTPLQTAALRKVSTGETPLFPLGFGLKYGQGSDWARLPDDLTPDVAAAPIDTRVFLNKGKTGQGWRVFLGDSGEKHSLLGEGGGNTSGPVRVRMGEASGPDAVAMQWSGGSVGRIGFESSAPIDLHREANGQLSLALDYTIATPPSDTVEVAIECGTACRGSLPIDQELRATPPGEQRTLKIPLSCFEKGGADLGQISAPFVLSTSGKLELSVSSVRLESGTTNVMTCR